MGDRWEQAAGVFVRAVLGAADPSAALERSWPSEELRAQPVRMLVVGKAAVTMARYGLARAGTSLSTALVVTTPHSEASSLGVETIVADHPLATERNVAAAARVEEFVRATATDEVLMVLLSGGGSALLTSPAEGLGLDDLRAATSGLLRAGATIGELNAVRKHCERLKGGRLARMVGNPGASNRLTPQSRVDSVARAGVVVLVVSDVLGDRLDVISSGPFAPDPTTYADALRVVESRGVASTAPSVVEHLRRGVRGDIEETPKAGNAAFAGVLTRVIAGNQSCALAARDAAMEMGFGRVKVVLRVEGEAAAVGTALVRDALAHHAEGDGDSCVIYAGETTVTVGEASGVGGRNQEMGLAAAIELDRSDLSAPHSAQGGWTGGARGVEMCVVTLATDGVDGPTNAAGAMVCSETAALARDRGIDLMGALARHDSHAALGSLGSLIRTGPTGTNVNDVAVAMVRGRVK